jgi:GH35 family endo-1,4-beta-xylanase
MGVRLDTVGIQSHLRLDDPDAPDRLDRAIAAYAAEGVKVMISELDVDVLAAAAARRPRRSGELGQQREVACTFLRPVHGTAAAGSSPV